MEFKIKSKKITGKYLYGEILENKESTTLVMIMSGLTGGGESVLVKKASRYFFKQGFSTVRFNFCNDPEEEYRGDLPNFESMSLSVYAAELKNIMDHFSKKYTKVVLIGHSFGAVISIFFLKKYQKYAKGGKLVLWDPTLLPVDKKSAEVGLEFDKSSNARYIKGPNLKIEIHKKLYNEFLTIDTVSIFRSLRVSACIIGAEKGEQESARAYFPKMHGKKAAVFYIVKKAGHMFGSRQAQKELLEKTSGFLSN